MPLLEVHDFPDDIYAEVVFDAQVQHRTVDQQVIMLIKKGLDEEVSNRERRKRVLEELKTMTVSDEVKSIDAVKLIREGRERR